MNSDPSADIRPNPGSRTSHPARTLDFPRLDAARRDDFPRLGWVCELNGGGLLAHVGADVEVFTDGLVEGCWDGSFDERDFAGSPNLFGSGVCLADGRFWFCPPVHTADCLYAIAHRGRRLVANSLYLLLRESGAALDPRHNYTKRLFTLAYGIDEADEVIYQDNETVLYRVLYDDFTFDDGPPARRRKRDVAVPLPDFSSYREHLLRVIQGCVRNANAPARRRAYRLLATVSSGYDSTMAAALGKAAGCTAAITVRSGRRGRYDSGRPAAEAMGLTCIERERADPTTQVGRSEIEFLMTGTGGADYPLSVFADVLDGAICLTGYMGDKMWDLHGRPNTTLDRGDNIGASLAEFRLRVGFIHLPVPFIAARRHPDVHAISRMPEMLPWVVGGGYDRPIARRIIEEAGVPRGLFAQEKKGMALIFSWGPMFLSRGVRDGFAAFLRQEGRFYRVYAAHGAFHLGHLCFRTTRKLAQKTGLEGALGAVLRRLHRAFRPYENSPFANLLFVWAMREALSARFVASQEDRPAASAPAGPAWESSREQPS